LRALHASPGLVHVRLESHRHVAQRLADACAPHLPGVDPQRLWQRLRLAVEIGFAADAMLAEEDRVSADIVFAEVAGLLATAVHDLAGPPAVERDG
jgi:hypothetical protein